MIPRQLHAFSGVPGREGRKLDGDNVFVGGGTVLSLISTALVTGSEMTVRGLSASMSISLSHSAPHPRPLRQIEAGEVAQLVRHLLCKYGVPRSNP